MELRTTPADRSGGIIVHRQRDEELLDLPAPQLQNLMKTAGVVMFQGFGVGPELMKEFANKFSHKFNRDRLRPTVAGSDGHVQMVNEGMGYVDPHCEQANSPFRPDALWFSCTKPAETGGETLYWDGIRVWENLDEPLKRLFREKKLRFFQAYEEAKWKLFLGQDSSVADIGKTLDGLEGVSYHVNAARTLYLEYVCSPVVRTRYGSREAFANSLMSEWRNTLGELMTFDDGTPITREIIDAVDVAYQQCTEAIDWHPGDMVFIDNSRFVHGRNGFSDPSRRIYSCLSFLNF